MHATAAIVRNSAPKEEDEMKMQRERNYQCRKKARPRLDEILREGWQQYNYRQ